MNNIYKVIWSKAKNCYVVASEIARSHTKSATGSEKIGGVTRRSLLASLMALSLLCGGLGVASAANGTVHVAESAASSDPAVYTTEKVNTLLEGKADKTALENKANATDVAKNTENIATNTANINTLRSELGNKADESTVTAALGGKANTSLNNLDEAGKSVIKTMMADELAKKADKSYVDNAVAGAVTTAGTNVNEKLKDYAKTTYVDTEVGKKANKATTLAGYEITDAYTKEEVARKLDKKADLTALNQATDKINDQQTAIDDLKDKTTEISYADGEGTKISGVTIKNGNIVGDGNSAITQLANVETDKIKTGSINGKSLVGTTVATAKDVEAEALARTEADNKLEEKITKNTQDIATLGGKVTTAEGNITDLKKKDTELEGRIKNNEGNIETNKNAISDIKQRTAGIDRIDATNETTIEKNVTVDNKGNVKAKGNVTADGKLTGKGVDAGDGDITTEGAVNAGSLKVENDSILKGNVTMNQKLSVTGDTSLGKTDVGGALNVTGASNLQGNVTLGTPNGTNTVTVNGTANFHEEVKMNNGLTVTNGETNLQNTTVDGNLKVTGTITTDKMVFGDPATGNYTEIDQGKVTSKNVKNNGAGQLISSSSTFDAEKNEVGFVNNATGEQSYHKQTSDIIMDNVKDRENSNNRTQTKTETKDIITDKDGNSSTTSQTASENKTYLTDKDRKNTNSTIDTAKGYDKTIKGENGETSTKQDELDITNTAKDGTITNDAQNIVNNANGDMTNTVGGKLTTTVTGQATEDFNGGLDTNVKGTENHTVTGDQNIHVTGKQTNKIDGNQENTIGGSQTTTVKGKVTENYKSGQETTVTGDKKTTVTGKTTEEYKGGLETTVTGDEKHTVTGNQTTNVTGDILNTAKNITNEANETLTDKVGTNTRVTTSTSIIDTVGTTTNRKIEDGKIIDTANDSTVTTENGKGTTFTKTGSTAFSTAADAPTDTNIAGNLIKTGRVEANELKVSDKDDHGNTADLSVKAGEGVKASASDGATTGSLDVTAKEVGSSVTDASGKGSTFKQRIDAIMMESKNVSITAEETLTNEAKDIVTNASNSITEKVGDTNVTEKTTTSSKSEIQNADTITSVQQTENMVQSYVGKKDLSATNVTTNFANASANRVTENGQTSTVLNNKDGLLIQNTANGTSFTTEDGTNTGTAQAWTNVKGNEISTGKVEANYVKMDYADVMKDLGVRGNAKVGQNLEVGGTSTLKGDVTMESNAIVKKNLTVDGITTTKTLKVTENAEVDGTLKVAKKATFEDSVAIAKDLSVGGDVTANSYKVGDKTYISAAGINANDQKITNVADGSISEGSKDAVNGGQLYQVKNDLEGKVNKVGANAAAMANLHPMEFDPDSKWNIAAAMGNYGSETATAIGAFYRPNEDVMVNFSTAFGTGENMVGGGVSVRLGKGGNKLSREENNALKAQVDDLTARMDALLSVLNPNMSKDFPDVPENHWAYEAVSRLAGNDIVQGYPDGEFHGERTMTRYEMAEIIYNALSRGAEAERELVEEFKPELQAMAASEKATAERAQG